VLLVLVQVLEIAAGGEPSAESLASSIEADPAFKNRVLRIANSAFYGLAQEIHSVRDAIIIIGFEGARALAISTSMVSGVWVDDKAFDARRFWMHGLRCGLFAEMIARKLKYALPEIAFTLGVLHDIGRIILVQTAPERYRDVLAELRTQRKYLWQVELGILGFHHGGIAGMAAHKWGLPPEYCDAIEFHHEPERARNDSQLARLLTLADSLSHYCAGPDREERIVQPLYRALWEPLGLDEPTIREFLGNADLLALRTRSFYENAIR
jgi:HD-like signal output (HDOD) protein